MDAREGWTGVRLQRTAQKRCWFADYPEPCCSPSRGAVLVGHSRARVRRGETPWFGGARTTAWSILHRCVRAWLRLRYCGRQAMSPRSTLRGEWPGQLTPRPTTGVGPQCRCTHGSCTTVCACMASACMVCARCVHGRAPWLVHDRRPTRACCGRPRLTTGMRCWSGGRC